MTLLHVPPILLGPGSGQTGALCGSGRHPREKVERCNTQTCHETLPKGHWPKQVDSRSKARTTARGQVRGGEKKRARPSISCLCQHFCPFSCAETECGAPCSLNSRPRRSGCSISTSFCGHSPFCCLGHFFLAYHHENGQALKFK